MAIRLMLAIPGSYQHREKINENKGRAGSVYFRDAIETGRVTFRMFI